MTTTKDLQSNQGEIEVVTTPKSFGSDPNAAAESGLQVQVDYDYDFSTSSDSDEAPTKHSSFICGGRWVWISLAAVLFTTFVMILGGAFGGIAANYQATQAAFKDGSSISSKSSKSGGSSSISSKSSKSGGGDSNPADAEEPEGEATRVTYEGEIRSGFDCGSDTDTESEEYKACVQSTQNALAAVLEEQICIFDGSLVPPCRVAVKPPQPSSDEVTDEADRRRLDHLYSWEYVAILTALGSAEDTETIVRISASIAIIAAQVAALEGTSFDVIYGEVVAQFNVLVAEMDQDPADYVAVTSGVPGYQMVGKGCCTDSLERRYDWTYAYLRSNGNRIQECRAACDALTTPGRCIADNGWTLVGFSMKGRECYCHLEDLPNDGSYSSDVCENNADPFVFIETYFNDGNGEGPVMFADGASTCNFCFRRI